MSRLDELLQQNKAWAQRKHGKAPDFFESHAKGQWPDFFWLGCSDSRIAPTHITKERAGSLFVSRNIANLINYTDYNTLSALQYAVQHLRVKHIVVCGHYQCGGVGASMSNKAHGHQIEQWLTPLRALYLANKETLDEIEDVEKRYQTLVELNVKHQVMKLANHPLVKKTWETDQALSIHGLVYDIKSGLLKDLDVSVKANNAPQFKAQQGDNNNCFLLITLAGFAASAIAWTVGLLAVGGLISASAAVSLPLITFGTLGMGFFAKLMNEQNTIAEPELIGCEPPLFSLS